MLETLNRETIETADRFEATAGHYYPFTRSLHLNTTEPLENLPDEGDDEELLNLTSFRAHEFIHHQQSRTTVVGFLEYTLDYVKVEIIKHLCAELADSGITVLKVPLRHWLQNCDNTRDTREILARHLIAVDQINKVKNIIQGINNKQTEYVEELIDNIESVINTFRDDIPALALLEALCELKIESGHPACTIAIRTNERGPRYNVLGSKCLFESWAHHVEMQMLTPHLIDEEFEDVYYQRSHGPYPIVQGMLSEEVPHALPAHGADLTFSIIAISDLALSPPLFSDGNIRWVDFHPGYRLSRIISTLEEHEIPLIDHREFTTEYGRFVSDVIDALKWRSPLENVKKSKNRLHELDLDSPILSDYESSLELRLENDYTPLIYELRKIRDKDGNIHSNWEPVPRGPIFKTNNTTAYMESLLAHETGAALLLAKYSYHFSLCLLDGIKPWNLESLLSSAHPGWNIDFDVSALTHQYANNIQNEFSGFHPKKDVQIID